MASVDPLASAGNWLRRRCVAPVRYVPSVRPRRCRRAEPYGVWGGFTETERTRLLTLGWQDATSRFRRRVDVVKLEAKLGRDRLLADLREPALAG